MHPALRLLTETDDGGYETKLVLPAHRVSTVRRWLDCHLEPDAQHPANGVASMVLASNAAAKRRPSFPL